MSNQSELQTNKQTNKQASKQTNKQASKETIKKVQDKNSLHLVNSHPGFTKLLSQLQLPAMCCSRGQYLAKPWNKNSNPNIFSLQYTSVEGIQYCKCII